MLASDVPASDNAGKSNFDINTRSIVLMFSHGEFDAVFTGDATFDTEKVILERYDEDWLNVELLKIGHHGSAVTSTSKEWSDALKAEIAIVSAHKGNKFGHPREEVISIVDDHVVSAPPHKMVFWSESPFTNLGSNQYNKSIWHTGHNKNIVVSSDGEDMTILVGVE